MSTKEEIQADILSMVTSGQLNLASADIAFILMASIQVGATAKALKDFAPELDDQLVEKTLGNLRRALVIVDDKGRLDVDWLEKEGTTSFFLDLGVAQGNLVRSVVRGRDGDFRYSLTIEGQEEAKEIVKGLGIDPDDHEALGHALGIT